MQPPVSGHDSLKNDGFCIVVVLKTSNNSPTYLELIFIVDLIIESGMFLIR